MSTLPFTVFVVLFWLSTGFETINQQVFDRFHNVNILALYPSDLSSDVVHDTNICSRVTCRLNRPPELVSLPVPVVR